MPVAFLTLVLSLSFLAAGEEFREAFTLDFLEGLEGGTLVSTKRSGSSSPSLSVDAARSRFFAVGAGVRVGLSFFGFLSVLLLGSPAGTVGISEGAGVAFFVPPPKEILILGVDVEAGVSRDGERLGILDVEPSRSFKDGFCAMLSFDVLIRWS